MRPVLLAVERRGSGERDNPPKPNEKQGEGPLLGNPALATEARVHRCKRHYPPDRGKAPAVNSGNRFAPSPVADANGGYRPAACKRTDRKRQETAAITRRPRGQPHQQPSPIVPLRCKRRESVRPGESYRWQTASVMISLVNRQISVRLSGERNRRRPGDGTRWTAPSCLVRSGWQGQRPAAAVRQR